MKKSVCKLVGIFDFIAVSRGRAINTFKVGRKTGPRAPPGRLQRSLEIWGSPQLENKQNQHAVPLLGNVYRSLSFNAVVSVQRQGSLTGYAPDFKNACIALNVLSPRLLMTEIAHPIKVDLQGPPHQFQGSKTFLHQSLN